MRNNIFNLLLFTLLLGLTGLGVSWYANTLILQNWLVNKQPHNLNFLDSMLTMLILPAVVSITAYLLINILKTTSKISYIVTLVLSTICVKISRDMSFQNYLIMFQIQGTPDKETLEVIGFEAGVGYLLSLICTIMLYYVQKHFPLDLDTKMKH